STHAPGGVRRCSTRRISSRGIMLSLGRSESNRIHCNRGGPMRVPISWLKEFVDITMPIDELAERITLAGLEVAEVEKIGVEGAELPWDPEKIVTANILEVKQHPNADRLVLADVDYGAAEPHT